MSRKELERKYQALLQENILLKERIGQLERLIFSAKRERFIPAADPSQGVLFDISSNEVGQDVPTATPEEATSDVVIAKKTKPRKKAVRNTFPASLPREKVLLEPDVTHLDQPFQIGEDVTEILAYQPAELLVKQIVRPRFVDKAHEDKGVVQQPIPPRLIPKGMVDESLIAQIINEKIQFHTPIYRFAKKLKQAGVDFISENNLHNWFHAGGTALRPMYDLLVQDILAQDYIQADETRMIVLAKNKIGAAHRGQMWAFMAPTILAIAFNYEPTRSTQSAQVILDDYSGILQVDGYTVYETIGKRKDIELIYCMVHCRRKFYDAQESAPDIAHYFLSRIQVLYELEQYCRDQKFTFQQRYNIRQEKAIPILKELEQWLTLQYGDPTILPKSLIGKAINYALSRWKGLCAYAYNGELEIDNNLVENTIRPIALGRKNYLFAKNHETAQNLAVLYSIIGTCLKNNINAYNYLHWILKKVATNKITPQAIDWLPHRIDPKVLNDF